MDYMMGMVKTNMHPTSIFPTTITHETLELRDVVQSGVNVWDFEYPSYYKGTQKSAFEQKVLDHFWTRQIGQETVGRFLLYFRRTVREIMPYYIQRYESVDLMKDPEIRPLDNYNMIEEYDSERSDTSTGSSKVTGTSSNTDTESISGKTGGLSVRSDTPQESLLIPMDTDGNVQLTYATEVEQTRGLNETDRQSDVETETESSSTDTTTGSGIEKHKLTRRGNIGVTTYAQLLEGYRETFLNIDMEIISELETCFLGVF